MERKLASLRTIKEIIPIEGADAIECVVVDGWQVVAKKGQFEVGELCVYFEIDSVLPIREEFEFLRKGCYVKKDWLVNETNPTGEGFRLKTIKLRGQISQGLVIPLNDELCDADVIYIGDDTYPVFAGHDFTGYFNVVKWDPPVPANLSGKVRGNFPSFIPKTDQERVQNLSERDFQKYVDDTFEITIKLDGSSMTCYYNNEKLGVCSRNLDLDWENDSNTTFTKYFVESGLADYMKENCDGVAIQGELMGPGIQGNRENFKEHMFFVFDMYDINAGKYFTPIRRLNLLTKLVAAGVNIQFCPLLQFAGNLEDNVNDYLTKAEGHSLTNPVREGIVYKSNEHPEFSFKVIANNFLLKEK